MGCEVVDVRKASDVVCVGWSPFSTAVDVVTGAAIGWVEAGVAAESNPRCLDAETQDLWGGDSQG